MDQLLADAASAARLRADDDVTDGAATRLRIRESLVTPARRRRPWLMVIGAIVASLFGSTAFAYWAGWRAPWSTPETVTVRHDEATKGERDVRGRSGAVREHAKPAEDVVIDTPAAAPAAAVAPAAPVLDGDAARTPTPLPSATERSRIAAPEPARSRSSAPTRTVSRPSSPVLAPTTTPSPAPSPSPSLPTSVSRPSSPVLAPTTTASPAPSPSSSLPPDPELAAYRAAHRLHFHSTDTVAALAAWDHYLAEFPNGKLAPEARYDRALLLVKLERWVAARAALEPFANAASGSYRQREAAKILAAIRDR
jgi:TolA-binding protein